MLSLVVAISFLVPYSHVRALFVCLFVCLTGHIALQRGRRWRCDSCHGTHTRQAAPVATVRVRVLAGR